MVAEALLRFPAVLQSGVADRPSLEARRQLLREYLALATSHPPPDASYIRAHLTWQLGRDGSGVRLRFKYLPFLDGPATRDKLLLADSVDKFLAVCEMLWVTNDEHACVGGVQPPLDVCEPTAACDQELPASATVRTVAFWHRGVVKFISAGESGYDYASVLHAEPHELFEAPPATGSGVLGYPRGDSSAA